MNAVRDAIHARLAGDATLLALLGTAVAPHTSAIYARQPPPGVGVDGWPLVVVDKLSGVRRWAFGGQPMRPEIWLVKGVSHGGSKKAEDIDERCQELLHNYKLTVNGFTHLGRVMRETDVDMTENTDGETYHHIGGGYRVIVEKNVS